MKLTSAKLMPMDLVYGDVHHFDILLLREDGTVATPKGIAWLDGANRRVRIDLVLCEQGTAIRNEDLILSFVKMTQDPLWGLPKRLYLDNGSEYQFAELLEAALKLARLGCDVAEWNNPVIRAQPYNAAAKGILEGTFRIIEQKCIAPMQGSIHGDRMRKKSASLGKATVPFGSFDAFAHLFQFSLLYFNQDPQKGDLGGLSPHQKLAEQIAAGWKPITIEESTAWLLFSEPSTAMVTKSGISVGGIRYHHDDLFRFNGHKLPIQVPRYLVWRAIPVFTPEGRPLCVAEEEIVFDRQDPAGAVETGRRKVANRGTIAAMAGEADRVDVPAEMVASAQRQPALPTPEKGGEVRLADDVKPGAKAPWRKAAPDVRVNQADKDALRRRLAVHTKAKR